MNGVEMLSTWGTMKLLDEKPIPVGSRVTCCPPPQATDEDFLCLVSDVHQFTEAAVREGFAAEDNLEGYEGMDKFLSLRKGVVNLIVTSDTTFYRNFQVASKVCRQLNLMAKKDRIAVFQAVLYRSAP